jgi:hypothetical protein
MLVSAAIVGFDRVKMLSDLVGFEVEEWHMPYSVFLLCDHFDSFS